MPEGKIGKESDAEYVPGGRLPAGLQPLLRPLLLERGRVIFTHLSEEKTPRLSPSLFSFNKKLA